MRPRLRKAMHSLHLIVSVGWLGAIAAYLSLDVTTVISDDVPTLRAAYLGMDTIVTTVIVPLAIVSLVTGLVVSLGTRWGLFRHYWVLISLLLTVVGTVVLLVETQTIAAHAGLATDQTISARELQTIPSTLVHSIGGMIVLTVVLILNVYKPKGLTPYGWRRQQRVDKRVRT
ncbi:MAG TPA: DUF2269 domain-containing protein [Acidimicrobiia bacterium]|jgi:hypothetical protein|nr:DUF2269 domain-containing protein [Acidimicrobiia bacterium]